MKELYDKIESYLNLKLLLIFKDITYGITPTPEPDIANDPYKLINWIMIKNNHYCTYNGTKDRVCLSNRRRSIGDIYLLAKSYNSAISIKNVHEALIACMKEGILRSIICDDIHKRVWRKEEGYFGSFSQRPIDEFGLTYPFPNKYESFDDELISIHL